MLTQPSCLATLALGDVPVRLETPVDDRLLDPAVLDQALGGLDVFREVSSPSAATAAPAAAVRLSIPRRLLCSGLSFSCSGRFIASPSDFAIGRMTDDR